MNRVGEKAISNCGLEMEIITYRNNHDLDVQFSDGEIVQHKTYQCFRQGRIAHPFLSNYRSKFLGRENINHQGLKMKVVEYISTDNINVEFEDGTIVKHKYYRSFKDGQIAYPYKKLYVGQEKVAKNGLKIKIVNYVDSSNIDVLFEDGYLAKHQSMSAWRTGGVAHPNYKANFKDRTGEVSTASNGMKITIIAYRGCHDLDVQFEDGYISYKKKYENFLSGNISHPTVKPHKFSANKRDHNIGKRTLSKNGLWMEVGKYRGSKDIDVKFDDGHVVFHKTMGDFNRGSSFGYNPNKKPKAIKPNRNTSAKPKRDIAAERVGMKNTSKNGQSMEVIAYRGYDDVDVKFEDGTIVCHKSMKSFREGSSLGYYPNGNKGRGCVEKYAAERIGMKNMCKNGMSMEIIAYRNSLDIDVRFEDGTIVEHATFGAFQSGSVYIGMSKKEILEKQKSERVGLSTILKTGQKVTIIEYNSARNMLVQFEDGVIVKARYPDFQRGYIQHPNKTFNKISFEEFLLANYLASYGFIRMPPGSLKDIDKDFGKMEFDMYHPELKIVIEFDGPFHNRKSQIKRDLKKDRLCQKHGIRIIRIRSSSKILSSNISEQIQFIFNLDTYKNFPELIENIKGIYTDLDYIKAEMPDVSGSIEKYYALINKTNEHIGERKMSKYGLMMEITEWINCHNITVKFSDGYTVKNRRYEDFLKDRIRHHLPGYVPVDQRVGQSIIANDGLTATIIAYRGVRDIDVGFSDGSVVYHRYYGNFIKGEISPGRSRKSAMA